MFYFISLRQAARVLEVAGVFTMRDRFNKKTIGRAWENECPSYSSLRPLGMRMNETHHISGQSSLYKKTLHLSQVQRTPYIRPSSPSNSSPPRPCLFRPAAWERRGGRPVRNAEGHNTQHSAGSLVPASHSAQATRWRHGAAA